MSELANSFAAIIEVLKGVKEHKMILGIITALGALITGLSAYHYHKDQQLQRRSKILQDRNATVKLMSEYRIELLKVVGVVTIDDIKKVIADLDKMLEEFPKD